jgi:hypothetical protein
MSDMSRTGGNGETTADLERIREDVVALREDLARVVKHLTRNAKGEMSEEARRLYAKLSDTGKSAATAIAHEVEEGPFLTLLLALGIGFIGGSLLRR